ncbi:hypothetical protein Pstr01_16350 [Pseudomonas straminea]|nr:hypothetical protein Pstr01_16350 [Pseudomonas straminea]
MAEGQLLTAAQCITARGGKRPTVCPCGAASGGDQVSGSLAITLISNWKPYSQVTPTQVMFGKGASPQ